ncbi:hypothetical protein vseg_000941 [Gypsophila vaccaria]
MVNANLDLLTLSPSSLWFNSNKVKSAVRQSITSKMETFTHSWYAASEAQRQTWWNNFKFKFQYKQKYEEEIKEAFKQMAVTRLPDYIYRQGKGQSKWMGGEVEKQYLAWKNSEVRSKLGSSVREGELLGRSTRLVRGCHNT